MMRKAIITGGVVVNCIAVDPANIPSWAASYPTIPDGFGVGAAYAGTTFTAPAAPPATSAMVDAERDRRIALGTSVTVGGVAIPVQTDPASQVLLTGLGAAAGANIQAGNGAATTVFRDSANIVHTLAWSAVQTLTLGAFGFVSGAYAKSWAIKALSPIPADYAADTHWA